VTLSSSSELTETALPNWLADLCQRLVSSPELDEILLNGCKSLVEVDRHGKSFVRAVPVSAGDVLISTQDFVADQGLRLDPLHPFAGGQLKVGAVLLRWHAVIPPISPDGVVLSLRRHRFEELSLTDFDWEGPELQGRLHETFEDRGALLVAGPTGVGKTTLLNAWLQHFARTRRVVILERLAEIPAMHDSWVRLVEKDKNVDGAGSFSLNEIFRQSLRLRPDLLVVGEIRGSEADVFLEAAATGHQCVAATIHASCAKTAWARLMSSVRSSRRKALAAEIRGRVTVVSMQRRSKPSVVAVERL